VPLVNDAVVDAKDRAVTVDEAGRALSTPREEVVVDAGISFLPVTGVRAGEGETAMTFLFDPTLIHALPFLALANCNSHPPTLIAANVPQYPNSPNRLHHLLPSAIHQIAHIQGSLQPSCHFVHIPTAPPTMTIVPV
jgi:hypothetical protein